MYRIAAHTVKAHFQPDNRYAQRWSFSLRFDSVMGLDSRPVNTGQDRVIG